MLSAICDKVLHYLVHLPADFLATSLRDLLTPLFWWFVRAGEGVGSQSHKCELISHFRESEMLTPLIPNTEKWKQDPSHLIPQNLIKSLG